MVFEIAYELRKIAYELRKIAHELHSDFPPNLLRTAPKSEK